MKRVPGPGSGGFGLQALHSMCWKCSLPANHESGCRPRPCECLFPGVCDDTGTFVMTRLWTPEWPRQADGECLGFRRAWDLPRFPPCRQEAGRLDGNPGQDPETVPTAATTHFKRISHLPLRLCQTCGQNHMRC